MKALSSLVVVLSAFAGLQSINCEAQYVPGGLPPGYYNVGRNVYRGNYHPALRNLGAAGEMMAGNFETNPACAVSAYWESQLSGGTNNPFMPHCAVFQQQAMASMAMFNYPAAIYSTSMAMVSGCYHPATLGAAFNLAYRKCVERR